MPSSVHASFRTGESVAFISHPVYALVRFRELDAARRCWVLFERGGGLGQMIETLLVDGVRELGDFAIASVEENGARFVVRGDARVETCPSSSGLLAGTGRCTWVEEWVPSCTSFTMYHGERVEGALPFRAASAMLPADALRWPADGEVRAASAVRIDGEAARGLATAAATPPDSGSTALDDSRFVRSAARAVSQPTGGHDGLTVDLSKREPRVGMQTTIETRACHLGHLNPVDQRSCRLCHGPVLPEPVPTGRPPLGRLNLSTGASIELDRSMILGRLPQHSPGMGGPALRLVQIDAGQSVSRSHLAVRISGWRVLVEDLGSSNGTVVLQPDGPALRLRHGDVVELHPYGTVTLGGEVTLTYDPTA